MPRTNVWASCVRRRPRSSQLNSQACVSVMCVTVLISASSRMVRVKSGESLSSATS